MPASLQELWNSLAQRLDLGLQADAIRQELFARYSETHRAYHNLEHLRFCFQELEVLRKAEPVPDTVEVALWFHDVIYDPRAKDNEEQSAEFFRDKTRAFAWKAEFTEKVSELILVTKTHQPGDDLESRPISDIDLAILGQASEIFTAYENQIRSEYSWVEESAFRKGRSEVLQHFLQRPRIYFTAHFQSRYEQKARRNLEESFHGLASLCQPL